MFWRSGHIYTVAYQSTDLILFCLLSFYFGVVGHMVVMFGFSLMTILYLDFDIKLLYVVLK